MTMVNDSVANLLAAISNGQRARLTTVTVGSSKLLKNVLTVLKSEGYVNDFSEEKGKFVSGQIKIELRYVDGQPVIKEFKKVSKSGRRVYKSIEDLPKHYNGLGISILSTSKGVMSDHEARQKNVGGEILCTLF